MIRNERTVISNGNKGKGAEEYSAENETGTGLVENEVTRRGNREGPRRRSNEGSSERAEGWKKNHVKYLFPRAMRAVSPREIGKIKRNPPGDSEGILFERRTRRGEGRLLLANLMISYLLPSSLSLFLSLVLGNKRKIVIFPYRNLLLAQPK